MYAFDRDEKKKEEYRAVVFLYETLILSISFNNN